MGNTAGAQDDLVDLSDSVVAITGAGGGIGTGIANRFAAAGASLVLHYRSSEQAVVSLTSTLGVDTHPVQADLSEANGAAAIVDAALDRFGRLDVVVNNAGIQPHADLDTMTLAEWKAMLDTNVTGTHLVTQAAAAAMIDSGRGGSILHIASIEGTQPALQHGHYSVSKAAIIMHAKAAALELGPHGIRVNSVSPGLIDRPGLSADWPDGVKRWQAAAPLQRLGTPEDVGNACVFLASPMAAWITGHDLVVDGGVLTRPTW